MSKGGYIKLWRSMFEDEFFRPGKFCESLAWTWLLVEASWKPGGRRIGERYSKLERGELIASVRYLAKRWDWTPSAVSRFLERCEKAGKIGTRTDTGVTLITICNYELYQGDGDDSETASETEAVQSRDSADTEAVQSRDKVEEGKNLRRKEGKNTGGTLFALEQPAPKAKRPPSIARSFPNDFALTLQLTDYAKERGFAPAQITVMWERFSNHHQAKGTKFINWDAAWRTWVNNQVEFANQRPQSARQLSAGPII